MRLLRRQAKPAAPEADPLVLVYTPGKDSGTSVTKAVQAAGLQGFHFHRLQPKALKARMRAALDNDQLPPAYISMAAGLRQRLINRDIEVRFVALVRDQLERTLAALFQTMHTRQDGVSAKNAPEEIFETWRLRTDHIYGLQWFEHEYRDQLGIDVYDRPFDKAQRYQLYPEHQLLVLRIDCEPDVRDRALSAHLGRDIRVGQHNIGSQKSYADAYSAVKQIAWAPEALIEQVYGSAHMRHFWSDDELLMMRDRWRKNRPA